MSAEVSNFQIAIRSTVSLYKDVLLDAGRGFKKNWYVPFIHLGYLVLLSFIAQIAGLFGGIVGGLILGMVLCVFLSSYFSTVDSAVQKETVALKYLKNEALTFFSPMISVLFALFLLNFVIHVAFGDSLPPMFHLVIALAIAILLNPLPEAIIYHEGSAMHSFQACFEFIKENFLEWFFPAAVIFVPLYLLSPEASLSALIYFITTNPLYIAESLMLTLGGSLNFVTLGLFAVPMLFVMYFVFIFRSLLYRRLVSSTRRKRIYQYRYGS